MEYEDERTNPKLGKNYGNEKNLEGTPSKFKWYLINRTEMRKIIKENNMHIFPKSLEIFDMTVRELFSKAIRRARLNKRKRVKPYDLL